MYASLSYREYVGWMLYWEVEPWGPWRDNVHAALIAREVRRPQLKRGAKIELDHFMLRDPAQRQREANAQGIELLKALSMMGGKPGKGKRSGR